MEFKISFSPQPPPQLLNYKQPCLFTGSCFSDHIATYFSQYHFDIIAQPNGVVFNPISIAKHLIRIINEELYQFDELQKYKELWHSWEHHSSFSSTDKNNALEKMNASLMNAGGIVSKPDAVLFITLGSAFVYELVEDKKSVVANCHKYPQATFKKRLLEVNEIVTAFKPIIDGFKGMIYFTVSPVRHIRDGVVENNLSKSILLQAVHSMCIHSNTCYYFPSYEIVMDELRDYRFYKADMVHPNELATLYVWQQFINTCMDKQTLEFIKDAGIIHTMQQHKIMHHATEAHKKYEVQLEEKKDSIKLKYGIKL